MRYNIQVASGALIATGAFLIEEHLFMWGGFDTTPGHEWLGLLLILIGMGGGIYTRKKGKKDKKDDYHKLEAMKAFKKNHAKKMKTSMMISDPEFSGKDTETRIFLNV